MNRRSFVTLLGLTALGAACAPSAQAPTQEAAQKAPAATTAPAAPTAVPTAAQPAATAPAAQTKAPATAKALVKFRLGEISNVFENVYTFVGAEIGTYRDQGIDIEFVDFRDGGTMVKALLADEIDMCEAGIEPVFPAVAGGGNIKIVGATRPKLNFLLFANKRIGSIAELKGASFASAAPGSFLHNLVVALLQKHNIQPEEVTFVNVGSAPDAFRAVDSGKVDAAPASFDFIPTAERNPDLHILANIAEELPLYQRVSLYTSDAILDRKRDAILSTMKGVALSIRHGIEHKEDVLKVAETRLNRNPEEIAFGHDQEIKNRILAPNLEFSPQNIEFMQQMLVSVGVVSTVLPFERVATLELQRRVVEDLGQYQYP